MKNTREHYRNAKTLSPDIRMLTLQLRYDPYRKSFWRASHRGERIRLTKEEHDRIY